MSQTVSTTQRPRPPGQKPPDLSDAYRFLQLLVGIIAIGLPFALILGGLALGDHQLESSLSAYHYTPVGAIFIGALCALGVFFLSYQRHPLDQGYRIDNRLGDVASVAAIGVALFPTAQHEQHEWTVERLVSTTHMLFAALLFVTLAGFCRLFRRSVVSPGATLPAAKRRRNAVYRTCSRIIVAVMALVLIDGVVIDVLPESSHPLVWLETVGVLAFGASWLVKSGAVSFLNDPPVPPSKELS